MSLTPLLKDECRSNAMALLICILLTKLTYGPLCTCISLVKAESFPTQIRVSAYALISFISKLTGTVAPTLIEAWKPDETAASWPAEKLTRYILLLMFSALASGVFCLAVPGKSGEGK